MQNGGERGQLCAVRQMGCYFVVLCVVARYFLYSSRTSEGLSTDSALQAEQNYSSRRA
jgi:hypothetical protein